MRLPGYPPSGPNCPNCHRAMWFVVGPDRLDVGAHYLCPDGETWGFIGAEHREIVSLEVARALGE